VFLGNSEAFIEANEYLTVLLAQLMQNAVIHNPREAKAIWIRLDEHYEDYELSIADNGPGIPDSRKQSLFDSGRRYGGIGLHSAHHIIERYGGGIAIRDRIDGDPSQGADFRVSFPKPHRHQVDLANGIPGEGIVDSSGTVSETDDSRSPIT
jgi:signal transduction histidine kinase